jgi:acyl dehydratase
MSRKEFRAVPGPYYLEDIELDRQFDTASRTVTETDVVLYSGLSGDYNALHTDEPYAKKAGFRTRIAHGPLVLAIAMGLVNRLGMTEGTSLGMLGIKEWRFLKPVLPGDTVKVSVAFVAARRTSTGRRGVVERAITVRNQDGETVQVGTIVTMLAARTDGID